MYHKLMKLTLTLATVGIMVKSFKGTNSLPTCVTFGNMRYLDLDILVAVTQAIKMATLKRSVQLDLFG